MPIQLFLSPNTPEKRYPKTAEHGEDADNACKGHCDERQPECRNCRARQLRCGYAPVSPLIWPDSPSVTPPSGHLPIPSHPPNPAHPAQPQDQFSAFASLTMTAHHTATAAGSPLGSSPPALPLTDLELLLNWMTSTSQSLAHMNEHTELWTSIVPREGLSHPFIMHGILAISALHIAYTKTQEALLSPPSSSLSSAAAITTASVRHYTAIAAQHQSHALSLFRPLLSQPANNINRDNCDALFVFSCLLSVLAFAFSPHPVAPSAVAPAPGEEAAAGGGEEETRDAIDALLQVFVLLRGVTGILNGCWEWVRNGKVRALVEVGDEDDELKEEEGSWSVAMDALQELNMQTHGGSDRSRSSSSTAEDVKCCSKRDKGEEKEKEEEGDVDIFYIYDESITRLRQLMRRNQRKVGRADISVRWVVKHKRTYFDAVKARDPMALVILAHYCVLLHPLKMHWWAQGWSTEVVEAVWRSLDESWRPAIRWVVEEVGVVV
ncbi:hypothetical protein AJ80_03885 [Polytolypa hystricis UAMH7299]|uniref:Zn(2)-C6 fungal-type domain-containing protein n=1 Tax=Polytolypa hystricis (strain UAMH7299) TaxID=1447883 RepID=A0A2B7YEP7_POLH7|nr:hypothetical protein AJ80_03885 [Polytolypa hystricis UAMH7299]